MPRFVKCFYEWASCVHKYTSMYREKCYSNLCESMASYKMRARKTAAIQGHLSAVRANCEEFWGKKK